MQLFKKLYFKLRMLGDLRGHIDTDAAYESIKGNIHFRGPNLWILAFSIVIASVGLNVNSTAVIIGAMLISPLMSPIIGMGLGLGTNDTGLIRDSANNLLIMVGVSLLASTLFFLISPLTLVNPTELESRTNPTIYDVIIALFGGLAGIFEQSRKDKGTVISGVAIATALMPPLCTAGYGLAHLNMHFFLGAMGLFLINTVFIALATYFGALVIGYKEVKLADPHQAVVRKRWMLLIVAAVMIPSIISAVNLIRNNNFEIRVKDFVTENRPQPKAYIFDYKVNTGRNRTAEIYITGETLDEPARTALVAKALTYGIKEKELVIHENAVGAAMDPGADKFIEFYEKAETEIGRKNERIRFLENELQKTLDMELPAAQVTREIGVSYPQVREVFISRGESVTADSLKSRQGIMVVATLSGKLSQKEEKELSDWLKVRLNDSTLVLITKMD